MLYYMHTDGDPTNYLTYFKRAAVYLAIGQAKRAIPDLDRTIELKPDFSQVQDTVWPPKYFQALELY